MNFEVAIVMMDLPFNSFEDMIRKIRHRSDTYVSITTQKFVTDISLRNIGCTGQITWKKHVIIGLRIEPGHYDHMESVIINDVDSLNSYQITKNHENDWVIEQLR